MAEYITETADETQVAQYQRAIFRHRVIFVVSMVLLIGIAIYSYASLSAASKRALREAKDVRMAMRLAAIESYAASESFYAPTASDGLQEGAAEKIAKLSSRDGTVVLTAWDKEENDPLAFTYRTGHYIVYFTHDTETDEDGWEVYYNLRVTDL
ncbi:MAG: hypothetical protein K6G07_06065 [Lachnospiraceae bacterium]|nr:hypothetical protein [Lachnospiraceae bacterium]